MFIRPILETANNQDSLREENFPPEFKFDANWYIKRYPEVKIPIENGIFKDEKDHYYSIGYKEGFQPNPFFCTSFVQKQLEKLSINVEGDIRTVFLDNIQSYPLSSHWMFRENRYRAGNPEIARVVEAGDLVSGFTYFMRWEDQNTVRPSALFDSAHFLKQAGLSSSAKPFNTFVQGTFDENISTSILFDPEYYRNINPGIEMLVGRGKKFETLIHHFGEVGIFEDLKFSPDFDREFYLWKYPDIATSVNSGLTSANSHFLLHGVSENRLPNPYFDSAYYIERQPEVLGEVTSMGLTGVFEHFLKVGSKRGLIPRRPLVAMNVGLEPAKALFEKRAKLAAQNMFKGGRVHAFPKHDTIDVSCILPVYNQAEFTYQCLRQLCAIANDASGPRIEVIVVDNGSTDRVVELERWFENIVVIREPAALGYTKACNLGAGVARGRNLLFMNNDMEVSPDAIYFACETVDAPDVGAAGGRIVQTNGVLQEAGNTIWQDGSTKGDGRDDDPTHARYMYPRDVDYCSGCFLIVKRELFEELDGFSEEFSPGYYEETDLCARLWQLGKRVVYDPRIVVIHYEYASFSSGRPPSVSYSIMARHRKVFQKRNAKFLRSQPRVEPRHAKLLSDRSQMSPRHVFIYDDLLPDPGFGSGFTRTFSIVETFLALDWRVTVWASHNRGTPIYRHLEERGVTVLLGQSHPESVQDYLKRTSGEIDIVWCCRTHNFQTAANIAATLGDRSTRPRFVCDTEAIAATREVSYQKLVGIDLSGQADKMVHRELIHTEDLDTIVVVNEADRQSVQSGINRKAEVLGHRLQANPQPTSFEDRADILFCGAIHEEKSPNLDSLLWYLRKVHPHVIRDLPDAKFRIVGYWNPSLPKPDIFETAPNIELVGPVSEEELTQEFAHARVFVAPTRYAGGIPYKVHHAMSLGLPAVVTPLLRTQLAEKGVAESDVPLSAPKTLDPAEFAQSVVRLYTDVKSWTDLRTRALAYIGAHCSSEGYTEQLRKVIEDARHD